MDENIFDARVEDTVRQCVNTDKPKFLGFLTESETGRATKLLKSLGGKFSFFGGFPEASRVMLCCKPYWCEEIDFPIIPITATFRNQDALTHRDILGALMGLGIKREAVGDILIEKGRAVFFVTEEISEFILNQLTKAGRVGMALKVGADLPLPEMSELAFFRETVSSCRLDCIVSALIKCSRNKAAELVTEGLVSINSAMCSKVTKTVVAGDKITVRGKGKFTVVSCDTLSKKGRMILEYSKYM